MNGHAVEFEPAKGGLACCDSWGRQRVGHDWVTELNWKERLNTERDEWIGRKKGTIAVSSRWTGKAASRWGGLRFSISEWGSWTVSPWRWGLWCNHGRLEGAEAKVNFCMKATVPRKSAYPGRFSYSLQPGRWDWGCLQWGGGGQLSSEAAASKQRCYFSLVCPVLLRYKWHITLY